MYPCVTDALHRSSFPCRVQGAKNTRMHQRQPAPLASVSTGCSFDRFAIYPKRSSKTTSATHCPKGLSEARMCAFPTTSNTPCCDLASFRPSGLSPLSLFSCRLDQFTWKQSVHRLCATCCPRRMRPNFGVAFPQVLQLILVLPVG